MIDFLQFSKFNWAKKSFIAQFFILFDNFHVSSILEWWHQCLKLSFFFVNTRLLGSVVVSIILSIVTEKNLSDDVKLQWRCHKILILLETSKIITILFYIIHNCRFGKKLFNFSNNIYCHISTHPLSSKLIEWKWTRRHKLSNILRYDRFLSLLRHRNCVFHKFNVSPWFNVSLIFFQWPKSDRRSELTLTSSNVNP